MSLFRTPPPPEPTPMTTEPTDQLTADELAQLREAEDRIQRGLASFADTGLALAAIKERRLYRATHRTWDAYLADRWKMTPDYAAKLSAAVRICYELRDAGIVKMPVREIHTRTLQRVEPAHRPKVWEAALEAAGGDPEAVTADAITAIAAPRRIGKGRKKAPAAIKLRGKGWVVVIERKRDDIEPEVILADALAQLRDRRERKAA